MNENNKRLTNEKNSHRFCDDSQFDDSGFIEAKISCTQAGSSLKIVRYLRSTNQVRRFLFDLKTCQQRCHFFSILFIHKICHANVVVRWRINARTQVRQHRKMHHETRFIGNGFIFFCFFFAASSLFVLSRGGKLALPAYITQIPYMYLRVSIFFFEIEG